MDNRNNYKKDFRSNSRFDNNHDNSNNYRRGNYNNNNNEKRFIKPKRPMPIEISERLVIDGGSGKYTYDPESLISFLDDLNNALTFSKINIPVYMRNADITNDPERRGTRVAGYITGLSVNLDEQYVTVSAKIYPNFKNTVTELIERFGKFHVKVSVNDNKVNKIIEFSYYAD